MAARPQRPLGGGAGGRRLTQGRLEAESEVDVRDVRKAQHHRRPPLPLAKARQVEGRRPAAVSGRPALGARGRGKGRARDAAVPQPGPRLVTHLKRRVVVEVVIDETRTRARAQVDELARGADRRAAQVVDTQVDRRQAHGRVGERVDEGHADGDVRLLLHAQHHDAAVGRTLTQSVGDVGVCVSRDVLDLQVEAAAGCRVHPRGAEAHHGWDERADGAQVVDVEAAEVVDEQLGRRQVHGGGGQRGGRRRRRRRREHRRRGRRHQPQRTQVEDTQPPIAAAGRHPQAVR